MMAGRQYNDGMQRMQSAAQRGSPAARLELARRVLQGPRNFSQEVHAISELQELDRLDFLPASFQLGMLYQSGTGVVPKNIFLARRLFRKCFGDEMLRKKAEHMLESTPAFTDSLQLDPGKESHQQITRWYESSVAKVDDTALLQQQFEILIDHYSDIEQLRVHAGKNDGKAEYNLAQSLQSHDLEEAMQWLERAAADNCSRAQYELAVRMIRGRKNSEQTQRAMRNWAAAAAGNGHVGAMLFIAANHTSGRGGFEKDNSLAEHYYRLALQESDNEILFQERIAGRVTTINRTTVLNSILSLKNSPE
jgi:TPR repeat protein